MVPVFTCSFTLYEPDFSLISSGSPVRTATGSGIDAQPTRGSVTARRAGRTRARPDQRCSMVCPWSKGQAVPRGARSRGNVDVRGSRGPSVTPVTVTVTGHGHGVFAGKWRP